MNIEELRKFCLSLPDVTEDIKWGHDLCFMINEKMFCVTGADQQPMMVSLKVRDEEFDTLCATENIISAPYVGRFKWVLVQNAARFSRDEWEHYITQSYELIKSKSKAKSSKGKSRKVSVKGKPETKKKSKSVAKSKKKHAPKKKVKEIKNEKLKIKNKGKGKSVGTKKKATKKTKPKKGKRK